MNGKWCERAIDLQFPIIEMFNMRACYTDKTISRDQLQLLQIDLVEVF